LSYNVIHNMLGNFIAGLTSGLFVTLCVVVFRALWISRIVPWFKERVYKDAKIEGEWFSLYPTFGNERQEYVTLKRHGHAVTGTMTCIKGGSDEGQQYDVEGSFRNMILPLTYEAHDRERTDRGTITLRLTRNAKRFDGKIALYKDIDDSIASTDVTWFRSKKDLEEHLAYLETQEKGLLEEYLKRTKELEKVRQKLKKQTAPKDPEEPEPAVKPGVLELPDGAGEASGTPEPAADSKDQHHL